MANEENLGRFMECWLNLNAGAIVSDIIDYHFQEPMGQCNIVLNDLKNKQVEAVGLLNDLKKQMTYINGETKRLFEMQQQFKKDIDTMKETIGQQVVKDLDMINSSTYNYIRAVEHKSKIILEGVVSAVQKINAQQIKKDEAESEIEAEQEQEDDDELDTILKSKK